jgi:hypothetical protein
MAANPTFEKTRESIRKLTYVLHHLAPQLGTPSEHVSRGNLARLYAHLAVLLTIGGRGNADVFAVTGGPLTAHSYELTVVGSLSSEISDNLPVGGAFEQLRIREIDLEGEPEPGK